MKTQPANTEKKVVKFHTLSNNFHTIITHHRAHLDEILADLMLTETPEGERFFRGASKAETIFKTEKELSEMDAIEWAEKGYVILGRCKNNIFNDHRTVGDKRKDGKCVARLVAEYLRIDGRVEWQPLLNYADYTDKNGDSFEWIKNENFVNPSLFMLASMIKTVHLAYGLDKRYTETRVYENLKVLVRGVWLKQLLFHTLAKEEARKAEYGSDVFTAPNGERFVYAFIKSDNELVSQYLRYKKYHPKGEAKQVSVGIIIQRNTSGNFQIFSDKKLGLDLSEIVAIIRVYHQQAKKVQVSDWNILRQEDSSVEGAEEIHYHKDAENIYNGTLTEPDVTPSPITDKALVFAIEVGLKQEWFESRNLKKCAQGICDKHCSWKPLGLDRCHDVRRRHRANSEVNK